MKEVKVIFNDESVGYVKDLTLDTLISSGKIKAFLRSTGWVWIGVDAIREIKYVGRERRKAAGEE